MSEKIDYTQMVAALIKPGGDIVDAMSPYRASLVHAAMGIAGEAGELVDAIKKHVIYNKPLDIENVIEELGDLEFYMQDLRAKLDITREECIDENIRKLSVRYAGLTYSDTAAHERLDKQNDV